MNHRINGKNVSDNIAEHRFLIFFVTLLKLPDSLLDVHKSGSFLHRDMGALLATPITEKFNESGEGNNLRYGLSSMQGWRVSMEDAHCAITRLPGHLKDWSFFAVFDGHAGALVSERCAAELLKRIVDTEEFKKIDPELAPSIPEVRQGIREGFLALDEELRNLPEIANGSDRSGSTAVCVLITPKHIFFVNCGDSRAVLIRDGEVGFATTDHKPAHPSEKERIQKAGGSVIVERVNGNLAVSRSLGDYSYKTARDLGPTEQLISPEPEITVIDRQPEHDQMVVLACDGVWDVVSNEDLCRVVSERMRSVGDLSRVCNEVIDYCLYNGSSDNMSMVLVAFEPAPKVDPELQAKDKRLEETVERMANDILNNDGCPKATPVNHLLSRIRNNLNGEFPPHAVYCKGALVQRILDARGPSTSKGGPDSSPDTNSRLSMIQQLLASCHGIIQNGSSSLQRPGVAEPVVAHLVLRFLPPLGPLSLRNYSYVPIGPVNTTSPFASSLHPPNQFVLLSHALLLLMLLCCCHSKLSGRQ
ncbi:Protein phosphatase 1B [Taenia crassiceps]|uniref:Protein phosphatase 1B n=1 Tax=Taenia crassiceps TaxID=6207 RepID=A0ABR4QTF6_9CEST